MIDQTDQQLIESFLKRSDQSALTHLVERHFSLVFRFLARYAGGRSELIDDVVQETFIKVWKYLKRYDQQKPFRPWLLRIAKNTMLDALKKKHEFPFSHLAHNEEDTPFEDTLPSSQPLIDKLLIQEETGQSIRALVEQLPAVDQTIVGLHHQDDLSFSEISEILDQPTNTIKSRYRRALFKLKTLLDSAKTP